MDKSKYIEAFNAEMTEYVRGLSFKRKPLGGFDRDDVLEKMRDLIVKVRDFAWDKLQAEVEEMPAETDRAAAADQDVLEATAAALDLNPAIQAANPLADATPDAELDASLEAVGLLKQARLEREHILDAARFTADRELLTMRAQISRERERQEQELATARQRAEEQHLREIADLDNDLRKLRDENQKLENLRSHLQGQLGSGRVWLEEMHQGINRLQTVLDSNPEI